MVVANEKVKLNPWLPVRFNLVNFSQEIHIHLLEERHNLVGQHFSRPEALRVQHDLCNQLAVRFGHGQAAEEFLQVVWQVGSSGVPGVHGDEDGHVRADFHLFVQQFTGDGESCKEVEQTLHDLYSQVRGFLIVQQVTQKTLHFWPKRLTPLTSVPVWIGVLPQSLLDALHLLRDGRQHAFLQPVELIETSPSSDLAQTHKNATHCLKGKVEGLSGGNPP